MIAFRDATLADVSAVVALLADDVLGRTREAPDITPYLAAFQRIGEECGNHLIVGVEPEGKVVATYQITFISGLSLHAARRAQIESVRVAGDQRGQGIGRAMFEDAYGRARAAGCSLVQLTMNESRTDARRFYESLGFAATHTGFKRTLD
ncbi:GNAT family N-acetyltransferase [Roseovarius sp. Pro17]|uniref:GNAT family N-acetyltransferase n=1 Tax=Roseovarius sp. Pro17 TaxID=3108175 RepID=UPI002D7903BC|nr:GNAT family N-acetyltransferase [Roseovarius sp. Pro17]